MFPVADVIPQQRRPYVTIGLIALHVVVFAGLQFAGELRPRAVLALGLMPVVFSWPALVSSLIVHAGWLPIIGNTVFLWIFGAATEDRLGHARYLALYVASGVAAGLGYVALDRYSSTPAVGAGGAISGVLGAYFALYPQSRVLTAVFPIAFVDLVEVPAAFYLGIWFLLQLMGDAGLTAPVPDAAVALGSNIVGFATGAAAGSLARNRIPYPWDGWKVERREGRKDGTPGTRG